jgi:tetratricopeptide (TPR) repeat protein
VIVALVFPHAWAWYHLRAARSALAHYHPGEARVHLDFCRGPWGRLAVVHLLASRAARQDGDLDSADRELRMSQKLIGDATEETAFEWALLQASAGNVREVEEYLQYQADHEPTSAPLVWEALSEGYLRVYRTLDAMACLNLWLNRDPENIRALELRGQTYVTGRGVVKGAEHYRRVLTLDPSRKDTQWRFIDCLLRLGTYDEASVHLEQLLRERPDDPEIVSRLARCYHALDRREEARQLLDPILAKYPDDGGCLGIRGQIALTDPEDPCKADAEGWIRRAAILLPEDSQTQWLLFEALRREGKISEAKEQHQKAQAVKDRTERLGELRSRDLPSQPLDPALHCEMGVLLIQTGHPEAGEKWLYTALRLDPNHKPSHAAMADYYDRIGDKVRAEDHRRAAK